MKQQQQQHQITNTSSFNNNITTCCYSRPIVLNNNKPHPHRGIITKIIKYSTKPLKALLASQTTNIYQQHPLILNEYPSKPHTKPFYMLHPHNNNNKRFDYMKIDKSAEFALVTHSSNTTSNNSVIDNNTTTTTTTNAFKVCSNNNFVLLNSPINSFRNKTHNIYTSSAQSVLLSPYTVANNSIEHSPLPTQLNHKYDNDNTHIRSTPCTTNKTKSKINWNKLSKFILNQPLMHDDNCIKKITLEQIAKNTKKVKGVKHGNGSVKKHYLKKSNKICNMKKQIHKKQSVFNEKNYNENNPTLSTLSLITKSNVSGCNDNSLCNNKQKYSVSPTDSKVSKEKSNNNMKMRVRMGLMGNRSDLCLKHSTIVKKLFKNK